MWKGIPVLRDRIPLNISGISHRCRAVVSTMGQALRLRQSVIVRCGMFNPVLAVHDEAGHTTEPWGQGPRAPVIWKHLGMPMCIVLNGRVGCTTIHTSEGVLRP